DVALTVDAKPAVAPAGAEFLGLAWIGGRKSRHVPGHGAAHPDSILLIDSKVKRRDERLAGLDLASLADDPPFGQVTLREVDELVFLNTDHPHVATGSDDDSLHQPKLAAEGDALRGRQRLAVLVEHRNGFAAIGGQPGVVVCVDGSAEGAALHSA